MIADREARERFACELNKNFSVIASAGSGKTRAITDRVVEIAKSRHALEWLPHLVVVTYTNRAADEMQQRTRQKILEARLSLDVIEAFNRAYFGTIHAFCMKLLAAHGHHLGLPQNLELITDDADVWSQFVQQYTTVGSSLSPENRRVLLRHVQARQLMELARNADGNASALLKTHLAAAQPDCPCPDINFEKIYATAKAGTNIPRAQAELKRWEKRWHETEEFAPWPPCVTSSKEFVQLWRELFRPLREWVNACAMCVAAEVQRDYREFRLARGLVTYSDQVALAGELMGHPEIAERIREKNYRVILDEAQDTDPLQFLVLLEIARAPQIGRVRPARTGLPQGPSDTPSPRPGHFSMVGDFQQSIYREPADLVHYRNLHQLLVETRAVDELKFSVTFRLDTAQLDFVNATFSEILNNRDGQVPFVELSPRRDVLPGQVIRLDFDCDVDLELPEAQRAMIEARELANWLAKTGPAKLRAQTWKDVAILSPRKAWLAPLRDALVEAGLPVEVHSESDREGESPAYAWLTALLVVMVDPNAGYEIVGVLREVFGLSDDELARFSDGFSGRFQIARRTSGRGTVPDTLNRLVRIRDAAAQQPLLTAVQEIVRTTQLHERLRSLPADEFGDLNSELDRLLSAAASAEASGSSMSDFAEELRRQFHATRETHLSTQNAIQLITSHKAKGSEWQAVIVPFLTREVRDAPPRYPSIIRETNGRGSQLLFDRADFDEFKEELREIERQEMERLLYVTLTRAKHSLVLAFDRGFFLNERRQFPANSQIKWLCAGDGECNHEAMASLSTEARECSETRDREKEAPREEVCENLGKRELGWLDDARRYAAGFVHSISPSKFAPESEPEPAESTDVWVEIEPELRPPRIDSPATRYGVWWHDLAQEIPWSLEAEAWQDAFEKSLTASPDPARSRREWILLRNQISGLSDFPARVSNGGTIVHAEMPFFWQIEERKCLEGIIDLALFQPGKKKWFILDWKTNRIAQGDLDNLRASYQPQIAAYWKAVTEMTNQAVGAAIYSTATGQFIVYDGHQLAREWERLRDLL
jgi:ATP-dependent exoDNAse (exonuclease V) beta subunit